MLAFLVGQSLWAHHVAGVTQRQMAKIMWWWQTEQTVSEL
jgi:hypothetical protein